MENEPKSNEDWIIKSLNIHGLFFQEKVASIIHNHKNKKLQLLSTEYPVEFPDTQLNKESCLDILAMFECLNDQYIKVKRFFLIECKKCNPEFVDWVFFPLLENNLKIGSSDHITTINTFFISPQGTTKYSIENLVKKSYFHEIPLSGNCRETRGDYFSAKIKSDQKTKTSNAAISDAAYQAVLACHSIASEHQRSIKNSSSENNAEIQFFYEYVPMIVTTANLFLMKYDLETIDIKTGEILSNDVKLLPQEMVLYQYPIPPHLQFPEKRNQFSPVDYHFYNIPRRWVLVVNSNSLEKCFDRLIDI